VVVGAHRAAVADMAAQCGHAGHDWVDTGQSRFVPTIHTQCHVLYFIHNPIPLFSALPKLLGRVLDAQSASQSPQEGRVVPSAVRSLLLVAVGGGIASFLRTLTLHKAQDKIAARIRSSIVAALLTDRDLHFFSSVHRDGQDDTPDDAADDPSLSSPAAILAVLHNDVSTLSAALTTTLANTVRSICSTAFSAHHLISLRPPLRMQLSLFSLIPIFGVSAISIHKQIKKFTAEQVRIQDAASIFAEERITNIHTVHIHNRQLHDALHYQSIQQHIVALGNKVAWTKGAFMGFLFAASSSAFMGIFSLGGQIVAQGLMTHGDLTRYFFFIGH
jgi:ABC-type multidrug transport system fused ATPase/permease subunit